MSDKGSLKRASCPTHHIDAGFINRRKCISVFGRPYADLFNKMRYPGDDHMSRLMNDHLMIHLALAACKVMNVPSLLECMQDPRPRQLFCSTEKVKGCGNAVYNMNRVSNQVKPAFESTRKVFLEYNTSHIYADTQRMLLSDGHTMSLVAEVFTVDEEKIIAHPLIMGTPTFDNPDNRKLGFDYAFDNWTQYQLYPEDIDQFSRCSEINVSADEWQSVMKSLSEDYIKAIFCKLLNDDASKDWGGEQYDHYTADISLNGVRKSGAFVFKGPAVKGEMKPKHLGKNGDQIYRLNQSNAEVLFVQHCHHIGEAVRETLRAFSVKPSNPRHYCLIDGKDTYRILKAYGLLPSQA